MTLSNGEIEWIETTAGTVPKIDSALDNEADKQKLLAAARKVIEGHIGDIELGSSFTVEMIMKFRMMPDFVEMTYDMPTVGDDPNEEFDPVHDVGNVKSVDPKQIKKLQMAQAIVIREAETLRKAVDAKTRAPLFTDREIADAIYEPLKRRKVMSEAMIPNRYSEVSRGFDAAAGAYEERLAAFNAALPDESKWIERLGIAKDILATGGTLVEGVVADFKALDLKMGAMEPDQVAKILKGVTVGISSTIDVTSTLIKSGGNIDAGVVEQVCKSVVLAAQSEIKAGFSGSSKTEQALGGAIASGIGLVMNGATLVKMLSKKDIGDIASLGGLVGDAVANSLNVTASVLEKSERTQQGNEYKGEIPKLFRTVATSVKSGFSAFGGWGDFIKNPTKETLATALQNMVKQGIGASGKITVPDFDSNDFDQALQELGANLKEIRAANEAKREEMLQKDPSLQPLVAQVRQEENAATGGKDKDELARDWQQEMEQDTRDFRDKLNRSETGDGEEDIETVEALMEQMKKDQMMVDLAFQLVSIGPEAVATFLPAAGIAVSAVSLVKNLAKAHEHLLAFLDWQENASDARSAMSFQAEAMVNRSNNSRNQTTDACANALKDAILIVTKSLSVAGPFAPAGQVATSVVQGVDAIKTLIQKLVSRAELASAYQHYLTAKKNPDDRKLLRLAVRKNATLAKYVIAWGAMVENDPVASRAMQKCGLTAEMLSNKNTNMQKCVSYLEATYPDDPVVMQRSQKPKAWHPGVIEFGAVSVAAFVGAAETIANPKLQRGACRGLVKLFTRWDTAHQAYMNGRFEWDLAAEEAGKPGASQKALEAETTRMKELQAQLDEVEAAVKAVVAQLKMLKPMTDGDAPHAEMSDYLAELMPIGLGLATKYRREAEALERQEGALQRDPDTGRIAA
jgi:hypothetical protein